LILHLINYFSPFYLCNGLYHFLSILSIGLDRGLDNRAMGKMLTRCARFYLVYRVEARNFVDEWLAVNIFVMNF
jgi:hypothetical protein